MCEGRQTELKQKTDQINRFARNSVGWVAASRKVEDESWDLRRKYQNNFEFFRVFQALLLCFFVCFSKTCLMESLAGEKKLLLF